MAEDWMNPEQWWPKRYGWQHPNIRNGFASYYAPGAATNLATHLLYNSSAGDRVIVVQALTSQGTTGASRSPVGWQQGTLGTHAGVEYNRWAGERQGIGQHWYVDQAGALTPKFVTPPSTGYTAFAAYNFPWVVLPPGWSFFVQANTTALTVAASFFWEEVLINDPYLGVIGNPG